MKKLLYIGSGIVVVIIAVVVYVVVSSGSLIKAAIEKFGPPITQTTVTLKEADVSLTSGTGALKGLVIGNPKGYKTPSSFALGEVSVKLDVASVTKDAVLIHEIVIAAPQITYELGGPAGDNIRQIRDNAQAFAKAHGAGGGGAAAKPEEGGGKKLIIENLYVRGGKIAVAATVLGGKTMDASLPDIHLKDIGKDKGGATPGEVADKLLGALNESIQKVVAGLGIDKLKGMVPGAKDIEKMVPSGTGAGGGVGDAVGGAAKDVGGAVKGLFGK
jgi:hypothetical protein